MMAMHKPTYLGRMAIALLVIIVGVPVACFLIIFSWGVILVPVLAVVCLLCAAPMFLLHYAMWGRALSRKWRVEAEPNEETGD